MGKKAKGIVTIDIIKGNSVITKPLIVVEGIDLSSITEPELGGYGEIDYLDFRKSLAKGDTKLKDLIYNGDKKKYDIIYLDFKNGADYMQRNALLVETLIQQLNAIKAANGSTEPNVVLGQSMGGVVARYALADMEERGLNHDTRLFISHDAPQQGANVPIGYQYAYRHAANMYVQTPLNVVIGQIFVPLFSLGGKKHDGNWVPTSDLLGLLDEPAAAQLISNRVKHSGSAYRGNYFIDNSVHEDFYTELKNKGIPDSNGDITGYPVLCRNIAISNGSECGATQDDFQAGDFLVDAQLHTSLNALERVLASVYNIFGGVGGGTSEFNAAFTNWFVGILPGKSRWDADFQVKSISYDPNSVIYKGNIVYTKKVLWLADIKVNITQRSITQPAGLLPYEYYGGGIYTIDQDPEDKIPSALSIDKLYFRNSFNFIPTVSALDIGKKDIALLDADYLSPYAGGNPPSGLKSSPFDNFTTEYDRANPMNTHNKKHITFNKRNGDWLAAELIGTSVEYTDCSGYCGTSGEILGADRMCSDDPSETYTFTGSDVPTWYVRDPDGLVSSIPNGNSIRLTPTGSGNGLIVLFANVNNTGEPCKVGQYFKEIWVGEPAIEAKLTPLVNFVKVDLVGANGTDIYAQGIISTT